LLSRFCKPFLQNPNVFNILGELRGGGGGTKW